MKNCWRIWILHVRRYPEKFQKISCSSEEWTIPIKVIVPLALASMNGCEYFHKRAYNSPIYTGVRRKFRIRDKKTESLYLVHPLTYRQVYKIKEACFNVKISSVLLKCLKIALLTWIWNTNFCMNFPPCIQAFFFFYASWQEIRILVLFGWGKNTRRSIVSIRHSVFLSGYGSYNL